MNVISGGAVPDMVNAGHCDEVLDRNVSTDRQRPTGDERPGNHGSIPLTN